MQSQSHSQRITAELRGDILRGRYRSGERLPSERDLAERFGVHRGSVREALKKLEQQGLADIRPGGARVRSIEEASLDVVEHLLTLEDPPNAEVAAQIVEVLSGIFSLSARLGAERADAEQREAIQRQIDLLCEPNQDALTRVERFHRLGDLFIEASGNLILKLVRNGVTAHLMEPLTPTRLQVTAPDAVRVPLLRQLAAAVEARDGAAVSEAIHGITSAMRRNLLDVMTSERAVGATQ